LSPFVFSIKRKKEKVGAMTLVRNNIDVRQY
jgi:hypothetical protein